MQEAWGFFECTPHKHQGGGIGAFGCCSPNKNVPDEAVVGVAAGTQPKRVPNIRKGSVESRNSGLLRSVSQPPTAVDIAEYEGMLLATHASEGTRQVS